MSDSMPLDESHLQMMEQLLELERTAAPILQKIKDCGLPCEQELETIRERADFGRKIKRNFFPDHP